MRRKGTVVVSKNMKRWIILTLPIVVYLLISWTGPVDGFISQVKNEQINIQTALKKEQLKDEALLAEIKAKAKEMEEAPVNAVHDRVWKAIPGYNGLKVDIDQTYKLSKSLNNGQISFVYEEVKPAITLDDLPPQPIYKGNPNKPM